MSLFRLTMVLFIFLFSVIMSGCIDISVNSSADEPTEKGTSGSAAGCVWPWCSTKVGSGGGQPAFTSLTGSIEEIKKNVTVYSVKASNGDIWEVPVLPESTQLVDQLQKGNEVTLKKEGEKLVIKKN